MLRLSGNGMSEIIQPDPYHAKAVQQVAEFAEPFLLIANRAERCRVETRHGRKIFDGDVREDYEMKEARMNRLLEKLFEENVRLGLDTFGDTVTEEADTRHCHTPNYTTTEPISPLHENGFTEVLVRLSTTPLPEDFEGYVITINPDYKTGGGHKRY